MVKRLHLLGTGPASGVPIIGCDCVVCQSQQARNRRLRACSLLEYNKKNYLIDAGPDFREQALKKQLSTKLGGPLSLAGVCITHTHFDHTAGLDDLRAFSFSQQRAIPCVVSSSSYHDLKKRYSYLFAPIDSKRSLPVQLEFTIIDQPSGQMIFEGLPLHYYQYLQADMPVLGLKIDLFSYITDVQTISPGLIDFLKGSQILVLSAGGLKPSSMHISLYEAIELAKVVKAEQTYFIHLGHDIDYHVWQKRLPQGMQLGYDGQIIEL